MSAANWFIADEFSKYAIDYDAFAFIQKRAASFLLNKIKNISFKTHQHFLEIGCGTGLFTTLLIQAFPESEFTITDISNDMLSVTVAKCEEFSNTAIQFNTLDGETVQHLDIDVTTVISAFTIQWFSNPLAAILNYFEQIPTVKRVIVSFLADGSFPEWKKYASLSGVPYTANMLPSELQLADELENHGFKVNCTTQWMNQVYPTAIEFFKSMKYIGAGYSRSKTQLSTVQFRNLLRVWDLDCEYGVEVKHRIGILEIIKK